MLRELGAGPDRASEFPVPRQRAWLQPWLVAQCPSGTSGPSGLPHLVLAHGAMEYSALSRGVASRRLSFHHPFIPVLTLVELKTMQPPFPEKWVVQQISLMFSSPLSLFLPTAQFYISKATLSSDNHTTALDTLKWEYKPLPILFIEQICLYRVCNKTTKHSAGLLQGAALGNQTHSFLFS